MEKEHIHLERPTENIKQRRSIFTQVHKNMFAILICVIFQSNKVKNIPENDIVKNQPTNKSCTKSQPT